MATCVVCAAPATHNSRIRGGPWVPICSSTCAEEYHGPQVIGGLIDRLRRSRPAAEPAATETSDEIIADIDEALDSGVGAGELVAPSDSVERAESDWKSRSGAQMVAILKEMRDIVGSVKDKNKTMDEAMNGVAADAANRGFVRKYLTKLFVAGFKVTLAGAKVGAGAGAETATVAGVPLDTVVEAVSVVLDALIFASSTTASVVGMAQTFGAIKDSVTAMMSFEGGLEGCAANVDAMFVALERAGLRGRAQEFMGSMMSLFERFVRWGGPIIGSVIGMVIPYDAGITGRVVEAFLYAVTVITDKAWSVLFRLWKLIPRSWRSIISDRKRMNEFFVGFVELMKALFPTGDTNWKSRLIDKARAMGVASMSLHPLVIVSRKRVMVKDRLTRGAEGAKKVVLKIDRKIAQWLDAVVIPNMDKIVSIVHGALGLGFSLIYAMHAYMPSGERRKLALAGLSIGLDVEALAAHMQTDADSRSRFVADTRLQQRRVREIMCDVPTRQGMLFIMLCIDAGIPLDASQPYMGVPALAEHNFATHQKALFVC